ncbi:MAG: zinc ribbon domain-containing protein, partial [Chloroflexota bacterium]|nr:zinc ribbon domain-containing protein [Chloroflexota bacterium]
MTYCQDCGTANEYASPVCKNCGATLNTEGGSALCPACQQSVGEVAAFCGHCGAGLTASTVEERPLTAPTERRESLDEDEASAEHAPTSNETAIDTGAVSRLELPAWLQQAATETPVTSAAKDAISGHKGQSMGDPVRQERLENSGIPAQPRDLPDARNTSDPAQAIPPLPDGGMGATMPTWLRAAQKEVEHASAAARESAPAAAARVNP